MHLWPFVKRHARNGLFAGLLVILTTLMTATQPLISKVLIDKVIYRGHIGLLSLLIVFMVVLALAGAVGGFYQTYVLVYFQYAVTRDIQDALFSRVLKLPKSFFDSKQTGYLMSRIIQDTVRVQNILAGEILGVLPQILMMPVAAVVLLWLNWRLSIIMLALIPTLVYVAKATATRARLISSILIERGSLVYSELSSSLSAVSLIKAFATEAQERRKFAFKLKEAFDSQIQQLVLSTSASALMSLSVSIGVIVCTWRGIWDVHLSRMTLGDYVAFCGYIAYILGPIRTIATIHIQIQQAMAALTRITELSDSVPEDVDDDVKIALTSIRGGVQFRDVCFAYDGKSPVLKGVSFTVLPGQKIAIVGPSGSGKTTLVSLLIRLYRPSSGRILVDGHNVEDLKLKPLRERIGIVSQDVLLLDDSILNNIRYGTPDAGLERVQHAAQLASADDFILALPNGYQTMVGERGVNLSAGERQRISLARVLTKDPDIVILDEPTAALDSGTEQAIGQALSAALSRKTTFVVAHRLSTVMSADRILVLDDGRVVQAGTHVELIQRNGLYRQMCHEQYLIQPFSGDPDGSADGHTTPPHAMPGVLA